MKKKAARKDTLILVEKGCGDQVLVEGTTEQALLDAYLADNDVHPAYLYSIYRLVKDVKVVNGKPSFVEVKGK